MHDSIALSISRTLTRSLSLILVTLGLFLGSQAVASSSSSGHGEDHHGHHLKQHVPGIFLGVTSGGGEDTFTAGIEYEYRLDANWGIGAIYERSPDRHHGDGTAVGLVNVHWHPAGNWRLTGGIGREWVFDDSRHTYTVYRVGASYDFHVGDFGIAPTVAVDFVDGERNVVYGLAFVRPF